MLAPILAFTADEAWEFIPGKPAPSVHLSEWEPVHFALSEEEQALWSNLFLLRELLLVELETSRQSKVIGKGLDASVHLTLPRIQRNEHGDVVMEGFEVKTKTGVYSIASYSIALIQANATTLQELANASALALRESDRSVQVAVHKASGQKCERCWHWETEVGMNAEHPTLCPRCVEAVKQCAAT